MKPVLSILEGKWFSNRHVSVRELFSPLFNVWADNVQTDYHYEQFTNKEAFRAGVTYALEKNRASTVYIGAHGTEDCLRGFHGQPISRAYIRNSFINNGANTLRGVYFGACSFGTWKNAKFVFDKCPRVAWMAGYDKETDWVDSGALDLFFLRHFLFPTPEGRRKKKSSKVFDKLSYACDQISGDMPNLAHRLGFHVFAKVGGDIVDLMANADR